MTTGDHRLEGGTQEVQVSEKNISTKNTLSIQDTTADQGSIYCEEHDNHEVSRLF